MGRSPEENLNTLLILAVLNCTHPAFQPASNDCGAVITTIPEKPAYRWLIRRRRIISLRWADTVTFTPHTSDRPGQAITLPCPLPTPGTWAFQVAAQDSSGNTACWSNTVLRSR